MEDISCGTPTQPTTPRMTKAKIERFIRYVDRDDVLSLILSVPEKERPAEAAELYNEEYPDDMITTRQAVYIGNHYYIDVDGQICQYD